MRRVVPRARGPPRGHPFQFHNSGNPAHQIATKETHHDSVPLMPTEFSDRIVRLPEVSNIVGLKRSAIYEAMHKEIFPKSIKLGSRAIGWKFSSIVEWIESRSKEAR